ncbi:MAG: hypothetical protein ACXWG1_18250 [Usitatibacter sp.]
MAIYRSALAALAFTSALTQAQVPGVDGGPPPVNVVAMLNLDTARAEVVEAILENAHERAMAAQAQLGRPTDDTTRAVMRAAMQAIRDDADKQLASVLNADELAKLRQLMPPPGPPRRPEAL